MTSKNPIEQEEDEEEEDTESLLWRNETPTLLTLKCPIESFPTRLRNKALAQRWPIESPSSRVLFVRGDEPDGAIFYDTLGKAVEAERGTINSKRDPYWIDIQDCTPEDFTLLENEFRVHTLTIEDASEDDTREKTELFDNYHCVVVLESKGDWNQLESIPFIILIFPTHVISFRKSKCSERSVEVLQSILSVHRGMPCPSWVAYALFDVIVDAHIPLVDAIVTETISLDNLTLTLSLDDQSDFLERIRLARSRLTRIRTTLLVKKEVLNQLTLHTAQFISDPIRLYLRDVLDQVNQLLQNLDIASTNLNNIPSTFLARLSVVSASTGNELAQTMKKLSAGALVMLFPTLVAGVFGMNMRYPGMVGDEESYGPFFGVCGIIIVSFIGMFGWMKWKRWI